MTRRLLYLLLLVALSLPLQAAPVTLIQTNFAAANQPVTNPPLTASQSIQGVLPNGWQENSTWNPAIHVRYQVLTEGGQRFWRVTNGPQGRAQIDFPLPDVTDRTVFDLTMTARAQADDTVTCGIREVGSPYTYVGPVHLNLTPQWQTFHVRVSVDPPGQSVGFWLEFGPGFQGDIRTFRLQQLSRQDLVDEIKARYPQGGVGNLARVTRFPLGLPVGWAVPSGEALGRDVTIVTDPAVIGPSGTAALRIDSKPGAWVTGAPFFVPWTFTQHVLSVAVRGQGTGRLVVRGDGQELASQNFTLSDTWQRVVVPFMPLFRAKSHDFQIFVTGTAWLDALQVEQGTAATPYAPPAPAEVALACPPSDAGAVRVQFTDEPDTLDYAVAGRCAGETLHARVTDIYGDIRDLPTQKLAASGRGMLRYAVFRSRPCGPFRVDAWVTDAAGRRQSGDGEIVVSRLRRPCFWGRDAPQSPFGVHINPSPQQALLAKAIGANWCRTHDCGLQITGWSFVEPTQGQWQFDDADLAFYRNAHLEVLGMLSTAPGWATSLGRPAVGYWDRYAEPNDMSQWANYVRQTTAHYKGQIHAYEIWNEPWGDYWGVWNEKLGHSVKTPDSVAHFALLQKTAYDTAKSVDPTLTILGFNTDGDDGGSAVPGSDWTEGLVKNGALASCDVVSYHHYTGAVNGASDDAVAHARAEALGPIIRQAGRMPKPVWFSEGNAVNGMLDVGMYQATVPGVPEDDNWGAANRLTRFVMSLLAHGNQKAFIYTMHEDGALGMGGGPWRTLLCADGTLHPCGAAYAALTWQLEGMHPVGMKTAAPGVTAFVFAGPGRRVTVYAAAPKHAPFAIPVLHGASVADVFGNPLPPDARLGETLVYVTDRD